MPSVPPDSTPDLERILRRVWEGRSHLHDLGLQGVEGYKIVISNEAYDALRLQIAKMPELFRGAITPEFGLDGEQFGWTMFGIPVDFDRSLLRNEIRFRSEVTVP